MNLKLTIVPILFFVFSGFKTFTDREFKGETFLITSQDEIQLIAEYYRVEGTDKPLILLFHQAGYSRGEYREIAPKLNELGFSCLAIDQRSGKKINGISNDSFRQAKTKRLKTGYIDALPDLKAVLDFVLVNNYTDKVILFGSSYSAALVFIIGTEYSEQVSGIIAFSPGQYFTYNEQKISDYAARIKCPVFITSAGNEKKKWEEIYNQIKSEKVSYLPDFNGVHGAKALWKENEGNEQYWRALKSFLEKF